MATLLAVLLGLALIAGGLWDAFETVILPRRVVRQPPVEQFGCVALERLTALRGVYEPYLEALADYLLMPLPPWAPAPGAQDNWETTAWDFESPATLLGPGAPFTR